MDQKAIGVQKLLSCLGLGIYFNPWIEERRQYSFQWLRTSPVMRSSRLTPIPLVIFLEVFVVPNVGFRKGHKGTEGN